MELLEVFYLIKKEIRTTKIKDRVRAPKMQGNRVRKRKKTAVFFRVSVCGIFKIKKQKKKKKKEDWKESKVEIDNKVQQRKN